MDNTLKHQAEKFAALFASVFEMPGSVVDLDAEIIETDLGEKNPPVCKYCPYFSSCQSYGQFSYGCKEAYRWDGLYTFHCKNEMVLIAASVCGEKGDLTGGIVLGPLFLDNKEDFLAEARDPEYIDVLKHMPALPPRRIQGIAELLAAIAGSLSNFSSGNSARYFFRQDKLLNAIYVEQMKKQEGSDYYTYPIAIERKLRTAIRNRDKEGSQILLNQILANIYVSNNNNIEAIKPRITELIVVISRAAVDAGADINEILLINENLGANVNNFTSLEDLSAWVSNMMHKFISYTFEFDKVKHADAVYKVIEYIKTNYKRRITLDEIAANTYLSKTYLSSLFKKETGYSISEYINIIRIERSKTLLMEDNMSIIEIANMCGFEDQSYYTKVFKGIVGMTPKRYRENRGKRASGSKQENN